MGLAGALALGLVYYPSNSNSVNSNSTVGKTSFKNKNAVHEAKLKTSESERAFTSNQTEKFPEELGEKVLAVSLKKISQIREKTKLRDLKSLVEKIVAAKTNCIADLSCVDKDIPETTFTSPNYTDEHEKLGKALGIQRVLLEKGMRSDLDGKIIEKLLSLKNEDIKKETLAIVHLHGGYANEVANHLMDNREDYLQSGDFNDVHELDEVVHGDKAQGAYYELIKEFVADTNIPLESYLYKINDISVSLNQKAGIFRTICSSHKLQDNHVLVMQKYYSLNGIRNFANDCSI